MSGEGNLERVVVWSALGAAMLRYATPLVFAALGGVVSERAGVVNIGLEGMMLVGAFFGIWGADVTGLVGRRPRSSAWPPAACSACCTRSSRSRCAPTRSSRAPAVNLLALGLTGYVFLDVYGAEGTPDGIAQVPDVSPADRLDPAARRRLQGSSTCSSGSRSSASRSPRSRLPHAARPAPPVGGENPRAAETVGISVYRMRYVAVTLSGVLAALGGRFLSIGFVHSFSQNMTAGRGFIALAAVIFGRWKPGGALAAALLFGFSSALAQRLPVFSPSTATLFQALPYVLTLVAVAGVIGRSTPPAATACPTRASRVPPRGKTGGHALTPLQALRPQAPVRHVPREPARGRGRPAPLTPARGRAGPGRRRPSRAPARTA
jgi:simple sugar transport system permease protein